MDFFWTEFEKSGSIEAYLNYKSMQKGHLYANEASNEQIFEAEKNKCRLSV